jgi:hypothetical protein
VQQWKRRLGESVNKVLAVRESVGFNEGLSMVELDKRCWPWENW